MLGRGGSSIVQAATGLSKPVITAGMRELKGEVPLAEGRIRREGAGRKRTEDTDPTLLADLEQLLEPSAMVDPESPLRWTIKSLRTLAEELEPLGHRVSHRMVEELLAKLKYGLQGNRKTLEGGKHPDRNEQFLFINQRAKAALEQGQPVISVDTKKKEVSHFPPGTRKWNKIEHRLFSAITLNGRGKPLVSHEVIVSLIQATMNRKGIKVTKAEMADLALHPEGFHGEWNYSLKPRRGSSPVQEKRT